MRRRIKKGEGYRALADFFSSFEKAEALRKFDQIMKKYGEKTGSGYILDAEKLIKKLEKSDKTNESGVEKLGFTAEESLDKEFRVDLLEDGYFLVDETLLNRGKKALILKGVHVDLDGKERKAELFAFLKASKKEIREVETAGQALQLAWEDYTIDYEKGDEK